MLWKHLGKVKGEGFQERRLKMYIESTFNFQLRVNFILTLPSCKCSFQCRTVRQAENKLMVL